ncbi:MAG: histidine kinase [Flavobacteriales bacterium]|nr:histidine kinase [Flavobacteriales bacterium]
MQISRIVLILCVFMVVRVGGQNPLNSHFVHFTVSEGLPHENIRCIAEDRAGFIWVGTLHGLARFNGKSFDTYLPSDDPSSLPDGKVNDILCSRSGVLWIATEGGLCKYDPLTDTFQRYADRAEGAPDRVRAEVLFEDQQSRIWVGYEHLVPSEGGISVLDVETGTFKRYHTREARGITWLLQDASDPNIMWSGGTTCISRLDITSGSSTEFVCSECRNEGFIYWSGLQTDSSLIIPHYYDGVFEMSKKTGNWYKINGIPQILELSQKDTIFQFSSVGKGFGTFSRSTSGSYTRIEKGSHYAIPSNQVRTHFEDHLGRIWVGHNQGLSVWDPALNAFSTLEVDSGMKRIIGADGFRRVAHMEGMNEVLAASSKKGLFKLDRETLQIKGEVDFTPFDDPSPFVSDMIDTPDGPLILTRKSLYRLDPSGALHPIYTFDWSTDSLRPSNRIVYHSPEHICINGYNDYIYEINEVTQSARWFHASQQTNERRNIVSGTHYSPDGTLWFSSYFARGYVNPDSTITNVEVSPYLGEYRTPTMLNQSLMLNDSLIVYGTQMLGLVGYNTKSDSIFTLGDKENYWLQQFVSDHSGRIWAGTDRGLLCLNLSTQEETWFSLNDGLPKTNLVTFGMSCDFEGNIWMTVDDKIVTFHPDALLTSVPKGEPVFQELEIIGGEHYNFYELEHISEINIPWRNNDFRFQCTIPDNLRKTGFQLEYRLSGLDENWIHTDQNGFSVFTNFPGGNYTLEVRPPGGNNVLSKSIFVETPWFSSWWFRTLVVVAIGLGIVLLFTWRLRSIRRENERMANQGRRIAELKMTALRSQMNPHFMFNSLNSIKHYIIKSEREQAADYITLFSTMIRKMLNHSRTEFVSLREEVDFLNTYLEMERMRFEQNFTFTVDCESCPNPEHFMIPPMLIQPFCENSIWHGLMPREENRRLLVSFAATGNMLTCIVEDNGIGLTAAKKSKTHSTKTRKSHGMNIIQERIELLNATHNRELRFEIEELFHSDQTVRGTRITLQIPNFNENH